MPVIYEARIDSTDNPKSYRIHWHNLAAQSQDAFTQFDQAPTSDEVQRLWLKPAYHHSLGQKLFRFLDGDARQLQRAIDDAMQAWRAFVRQLCDSRFTTLFYIFNLILGNWNSSYYAKICLKFDC